MKGLAVVKEGDLTLWKAFLISTFVAPLDTPRTSVNVLVHKQGD